jgi:hypothetical protein
MRNGQQYRLERLNDLQRQIEQAEKAGQPVAEYVREQIIILEQRHDEFVKETESHGISILTSLDYVKILIKQL